MSDGNPLVAQAQSQTTAVTGIGIAESAVDLANGVKDGSWVEFGMGALGVGLEALSMVMDPIGTLAQYGASWLIEHVQPLKEALDWLAGDPPVIQSFADTWANVAQEVGAVAGDLSNETVNGTAGWTGEGGDAYRAHAAEQSDAIAGAATLADGISTGVMVMGQVVAMVRETVRDLVAELVGKLISWVLEEACTLGFATPLVAAQATTAITNAISKVSDLIRKLVKTIGNVTPKIRRIVDKLGEIIEKLSKLGRKVARRADGATVPSGAKSIDTPELHAPDAPHTPHTPDADVPGGTHAGDGTTTASREGSLRSDAAEPRDRAQEVTGRCGGREPIDLATGEMYLTQTDVDLPGILPLLLQRTHISSYRSGRLFGPTWASTLDQRLEFDDDGVCYAGPDGVILVYPRDDGVLPVVGARWPLHHSATGSTLVQPQTGRTLHFGPPVAGTAKLAAITDRTGHRIDLDYDDTGLVRRVRHSGGYVVDVETRRGLVAGLWLGEIPLARFDYDDARRLVAVVNSSGLALRFGYDAEGRIVEWVDRNGRFYRYHYDENGRCVRTEGSAVWGTIAYDPLRRTTVETNSLGEVTTHQFNEANKLVRRVNPLGAEISQEWDAEDRLLSYTDELGRETRYTYDENGNLTRIRRPDGTVLTSVHNELNLPVSITGPGGATTTYTYDERGNRTSVTDAAGTRTLLSYDERGHLTRIVDGLGNAHHVVTNDAGLPMAVTDPEGGTVHYTRDVFNRVTSVTDQLGGVTRYTWTIEGLPASRTTPDGAVERWRYDGEGNLVEHIGPTGARTTYEVSGFDQVAARTTPDGARIGFRYDSELRLVEVTNAAGASWSYRYDAAGNLVGETDFNGRTVTYRHDAAGQLVERVNGAGQSVHYTRDALGRVVEQRAGDRVSRFTYRADGELIEATNPDAEVRFDRDVLGNVLAEHCNGRTLRNTYDALGHRTSRTTPAGTVSTYRYDSRGFLSALAIGEHLLEFAYDPVGRERTRRLDGAVTVAQSWDAQHRLTAQVVSAGNPSGPDRVLQQRAYRYRADGALTAVDDLLRGTQTYDLDAAGRVTAVSGRGWRETYAYDPAGNLAGARWSTPGSGDDERQGERVTAGTLVRSAGRTGYQHDAQGRVVRRTRHGLSGQRRTWTYTWDAEDRLTAVTTPDGHVWRYSYDALGRRIAKLHYGPGGTELIERTDFTWDRTVLAEQTTSSGTTSWDYEPGSTRPLAQAELTRDEVDRRFYAIVTDLVGTPTELIDPGGAIRWHARTTLWGAPTFTPRQAADCPLRFPGQYHDPETGLNYNYLRYYDPDTGSYASPDPLGLEAAPNNHAYVANPATAADPTGLIPCDVADDLAAYRQRQGMPVAGSAEDAHTAARLDVDGQSFYGRNGHGMDIDIRANAQTKTHAEAQAFQEAKNAGVSGKTGTLYVDRDFCRACGPNGGVGSLMRGLGLERLEVHTPSGRYTIDATKRPSIPVPWSEG
ncbi:DUF6531 domain-containing protein [Amycolatopsis sacchari]|uniref:DUF6531 domain-containing protein n=1 Tax=Amycolatopsis sacchari TaxID=115433 RepID=UPI003D7170FB